MKYRKLGQTDMEVSVVCQGCWSIVTSDGTWGPNALEDSYAAIRASLDAGVNFFDTAEVYGAGESEEILAEGLGERRKDVIVASKAGGQHLDAAGLRAACEGSLRRLKTDYIDLYQIHWPSRTVAMEETLSAMLKLKEEGKIRAIGVSNFGPDDMAEATGICSIESNQLPYNLLWRAIEFEIEPACAAAGASILCYSSLCQSLLTGKFATPDDVPAGRTRTRLFSGEREGSRHGQGGCERETFEAIAAIRSICESIGQSMTQTSLAWLIANKNVTSAIVGARNAAQAIDNAQAGDLELTPDVVEALSQATEKVKQIIGANADPWQAVSRMEKP
ncbi:MAG: aldo/keto reductase [Planctomycetes bacterium]|nr:aldo/keto reductase [Planctomycetota bacterium]